MNSPSPSIPFTACVRPIAPAKLSLLPAHVHRDLNLACLHSLSIRRPVVFQPRQAFVLTIPGHGDEPLEGIAHRINEHGFTAESLLKTPAHGWAWVPHPPLDLNETQLPTPVAAAA